jgi:archaetidylinositol phosphate synthase
MPAIRTGPAASVSPVMPEPSQLPAARAATPPWDARLARALVRPLQRTPITANYLTTVRLAVGVAAAGAFTRGSYAWMNLGAVLLVVSNFLDHADGELARITGKTSRVGHWYDLASDAVVTILLFTAIGVGVGTRSARVLQLPPLMLGAIAGTAIALIFFLRAHIETMAGKAANKQASMGGFETEDVLYLLPLVTLCNGTTPFLIAAAIGAPLFAVWVVFDYRRVLRGYTR